MPSPEASARAERHLPTFSIVMPAFNTAGTIGHSVASVREQTRRDFELVVVDDGSTDGTADVAGAVDDERVRVVRQENRGAAAARNRGVAEARGSLVSFLDSDDLLLPSYLEAMKLELDRSPDAGFAYTDAWTLDHESGRIWGWSAMQRQRSRLPPPTDSRRFLLALLKRNFVYTAVTARREVLDRVGPFREDLQASIDYEMWLRMAAHGFVGVRVAELLAVYRQQRPGSIQSDPRRTLAALAEVYRIVADEYAVSADAKQLARRRRRATLALLAAFEGRRGLRPFWHRRLRPLLGGVRRGLRRDAAWLDRTPDELASAFPWLAQQRPSGGHAGSDGGGSS